MNDKILKWSSFIQFFVFYLGLTFTVGIGLGILDIVTSANVTDQLTLGYRGLLVDASMFMLALLSFKGTREFIFSMLNFSVLKHKSTYLYVILSFIIFYAAQYLFIEIAKVDNPSNQDVYVGLDQVDSLVQQVLYFVSLAVITPIKEELLYRGLIYRFFEVRYSFWAGLLISSLVFGLLHTGYPISAAVMGAIFVILMKVTRSILPAMMLHMLWNLYAAFLIMINYS